jgi:hypothetical protein
MRKIGLTQKLNFNAAADRVGLKVLVNGEGKRKLIMEN